MRQFCISLVWMEELLTAQKQGKDLPPHVSSQKAAELPKPAHSLTKFPGHAAWITGDWKLHRITKGPQKVSWELYNLAKDPKETTDLANQETARVKQMQKDLTDWLKSVAQSLNGEDYAGQ